MMATERFERVSSRTVQPHAYLLALATSTLEGIQPSQKVDIRQEVALSQG